ncbi:ankyrin, partial [Thozetella sp. PMI_491]
VKLLTEAGAKANLRDSDGKTPLFYALKRTDPEMAKLLIAAEADVNSPDWAELTALHFAAAHGSSAMVELLKAKGADDKLKRKTWKITPLHLANRSAGQALLDAGANLSAMDSKGRQLIHWAAMAQRPDAVALALGHGAEVDHRDAKMETPLS